MAEPDRLQSRELRRRLVLPARIDSSSLTSLQRRLVRAGSPLIKHARYYLLLAESHLTRRLPALCGRTRRRHRPRARRPARQSGFR
jgi:hypothetical protein